MGGCFTSMKQRLVHSRVERSMQLLGLRIEQCEQREKELEARLMSAIRQLQLVASTMKLGTENTIGFDPGAREVLQIRLQQLVREKRAAEAQLRRAVRMTGTMRRELEGLDESATNVQVVDVLRKVLSYTRRAQDIVSTEDVDTLVDDLHDSRARTREMSDILEQLGESSDEEDEDALRLEVEGLMRMAAAAGESDAQPASLPAAPTHQLHPNNTPTAQTLHAAVSVE